MPIPTAQNPTLLLAEQAIAKLQSLRQLGRLELSTMVALSALTGYLFAGGAWQIQVVLMTTGVGLLAAGSSALNQWQEQDLDIRMERTKQRPLPAGKLSPATVLVLASLSISCGLALLATAPGRMPLLLGILTLIWYNTIYTPLKRLTPFAAFPGALCGALPPLIGWSAAGGSLISEKSLILAGTLFVWQIPHTWLLLCRYRDDLQRSGLPNIFRTVSTQRLLKINTCWLTSLFLCYLLFPLFGFIKTQGLIYLFIVGLFAIILAMIKTPANIKKPASILRTFHLTNISMAVLFTTLILDRLFI